MKSESNAMAGAAVSALFDDELEPQTAQVALAAVAEALRERETWRTYACIGDALRGEQRLEADLTAGVMARLTAEPVVLAPRALAGRPVRQPWLALAASLAGVAVVGWLALAGKPPESPLAGRLPTGSPPAATLAAQDAVPPAPTLAAAAPAAIEADMSEYLLAHQAQAPTLSLDQSTKQIRTVAMRVVQP